MRDNYISGGGSCLLHISTRSGQILPGGQGEWLGLRFIKWSVQCDLRRQWPTPCSPHKTENSDKADQQTRAAHAICRFPQLEWARLGRRQRSAVQKFLSHSKKKGGGEGTLNRPQLMDEANRVRAHSLPVEAARRISSSGANGKTSGRRWELLCVVYR